MELLSQENNKEFFFLSFLPLLFFNFSSFFYNLLKERHMGPGTRFMHLFGLCGSHVTDTCLAETILFWSD